MQGPRRSELGAGVIDGKIYAVGGRLDDDSPLAVFEIYDPATDSWTPGPSLPAPRDHAGVAAVNGKLYVIGGYGPVTSPAGSVAATVFEFDPGSSTWSTKAPMVSPRAAFAVAVVGTKIHCVGGLSGKAHEAYDVSTDTWEMLPEMPTGREHLAAASIGTTIYVVGGRVTPFPYENYANLDAYDTVTRTWTQLPAMPTARGGLGAAALDGKLYAFGGEFPTVYAQVEEYDPTTQAWRRMTDMLTPRHGVAAVTVNGWIHVVGGGRRLGTAGTIANEAFKPD
jgi:N-acetylneuraminic acid mutarotase